MQSAKEFRGQWFRQVPEQIEDNCSGCFYASEPDNALCDVVGCHNIVGAIWVPKYSELELAVLSLLEYFESGNSVPVQQATIKADSPEIRKLRELVGKPCT